MLVRARKCAIVRKNSTVINEVKSQSASVNGYPEVIQRWKFLAAIKKNLITIITLGMSLLL